MHSVVLGLPGLSEISHCSVLQETWSRDSGIHGCASFYSVGWTLTVWVSYAYSLTWWAQNRLNVICEWNLTHLCTLDLHGTERAHVLELTPWMGSLGSVFEGSHSSIWASFVAQLVKNWPAMWETWVGRSPGEGKGYPLQFSGLKSSMDCIVHGVAKSQTWLSDFHFSQLCFRS